METQSHSPEPSISPNLQATIEQLAESIRSEANVRAVFGDAIKLDERTIVPVATVTISMGGGMGLGRKLKSNGEGKMIPFGAGGGGGLDVKVIPVGFVAEREGGAAFVPIADDQTGVVQRAQSVIRSALSR